MSSAADKIAKSDSLLDIMIRMEDFLDSLDLYAYKNWIDGEVVDGPDVSRYWATFTLRYPYEKMPDPSGAERLMKHGAIVEYEKGQEEDAEFHVDTSPEALANLTSASYGQNSQYASTNIPNSYLGKNLKTNTVWLVHISLPRKFIDDAFDMDIGTLIASANSKSSLIDRTFVDNWADDMPPRPATNSGQTTISGEQ